MKNENLDLLDRKNAWWPLWAAVICILIASLGVCSYSFAAGLDLPEAPSQIGVFSNQTFADNGGVALAEDAIYAPAPAVPYSQPMRSGTNTVVVAGAVILFVLAAFLIVGIVVYPTIRRRIEAQIRAEYLPKRTVIRTIDNNRGELERGLTKAIISRRDDM